MRVAIFIRTFQPCSGGLQKHASDLARYLVARGHEVQIVTRLLTLAPRNHLETFLLSENNSVARIENLPVHVLTHSAFAIPFLWLSMKCVGRRSTRNLGISIYSGVFAPHCSRMLKNVDLVHHVGQGYEMIGFVARGVARRLGVPFLVQPTVHPGQWGDQEIDFMLYKGADRLLAHTEFEKEWLHSAMPEIPIDVVGNGVDVWENGNAGRFRTSHRLAGPVVLFLGRKDQDKGYFLLQQAIPLVHAQYPNVHFVLIGPSRAIRSGNTISPGVLEIDNATEQEKADALSACDMLCVPSEGESFGLVYMEAGRYSKAVIGRNIPVLRELLGVPGAALLVGTANKENHSADVTPDALAEAILVLLNNPALREKLGKNCRTISDQYTWSKVVERFESAYEAALNQKPALK